MKTYLKLTLVTGSPEGRLVVKEKEKILIKKKYDEEKENLKKYLEKHKSKNKNNCYTCGLQNTTA